MSEGTAAINHNRVNIRWCGERGANPTLKRKTCMRDNGHGVKTINLALQGGGSHGAFTWGVLDRLLDEQRLMIEGISGTSAGAMNAAALAQGWTRGGRKGAKSVLDQFWTRTSELSNFNPIRRSF